MIDYLAIGHVTDDLWPEGRVTAGGTVMYASRCARQLVDRVAVLTAAATTADLAATFPGIDVHCIDADHTSQFWNVYDGGHRTQYTKPNSVMLNASHLARVPGDYGIVHIGPVCNEVDISLIRALKHDQFLGITPQGWLRRWDDEGRVVQHPDNWQDAEAILARADAAVMSIEDINDDWSVAHKWAAQSRLLVVTQSEKGCTLFLNGGIVQVPAPEVPLVDPTGAGDIFAATFFIALQRGDDPIAAAAYANCIASQSVTRKQLEGLPGPADIAHCS